jgi:hypothetical protein
MTADTQAPRLEPDGCPFCPGTTILTELDAAQGDKWGYATCARCCARGPEVRTNYDRSATAPWRDSARKEWNTRRTDPVREEMALALEVASMQFRFCERAYRAKADRLHGNWDARSTTQENDYNEAFAAAEMNREHAEACEAAIRLHGGEG